MSQAKKIACFLVGMLVLVEVYVFVMVNGRAMTMKDEATSAQTAAEGMEMQVNTQTFALKATEEKTAEIRSFFKEWASYFAQTSNAETAYNVLEQRVTQSGIFETGSTNNELPNPGGGYVAKVLQIAKKFDEQYVKALTWLGDLEQSLPACQVSSLTLQKASDTANVTMDMVVNLPIVSDEAVTLATPTTANTAAKTIPAPKR